MFDIQQELEDYWGNPVISPLIDQNKIVSNGYAYHRSTGIMVGHEDSDNPPRLKKRAGTKPLQVFHIFAGHREWSKEQWVKVDFESRDPTCAAQTMKDHNRKAQETDSPYRFRLQKDTISAPDYPIVEWMAQRFTTGEYQPLPWANEPWSTEQERYGHISNEDGCRVAYASDPQNRDYIDTMLPGRYLTLYYSDILTPTEIEKWAIKVDVECELHFASTPDEIERVYLNGPRSCMSHPLSEYHHALPCHPTRVYGAGDLAIAYLTRRKRIIARTLCWPDKKIFYSGKHYGDRSRMVPRLREAGYTSSTDFGGARLLLIKDEIGRIVMPYLDFCGADFSDGQLILSYSGRIDGNRTDGWAGDGDHTYSYDDDYYGACEHCEDTIHDEDDACFVDDQTWCRRCWENYTTSCEDCADTVPSETIVPVLNNPQDCEFDRDVCRSCATNHHLHNGERFVTLEMEPA